MKRSEIDFQLSAFSAQPAAGSDPLELEDGWRLVEAYAGRDWDRRSRRGLPVNTDFRCAACGRAVTAAAWRSGVQNRNHCPHCLWSKHLDLHRAGDRLAACKEKMRPVGLALKQTRQKYAAAGETLPAGERLPVGERFACGELMLAHQCQGCGKLSVNRIAADDDAETLMQVFQASLALPRREAQALAAGGVLLLQQADAAIVRRRLFGGA